MDTIGKEEAVALAEVRRLRAENGAKGVGFKRSHLATAMQLIETAALHNSTPASPGPVAPRAQAAPAHAGAQRLAVASSSPHQTRCFSCGLAGGWMI